MKSKETRKTKLPDNCIFENVAPLGSKPNWKIVPKPKTWGKIALAIDSAGNLIRVRISD